MARALIGFVVGVVVGVGGMFAAWHWLTLRTSFAQESIGVGTHSHMKLFVHDLATFHEGSFDMDAYEIWFRFDTSIPTAEDYYDRVDAAIDESKWKLLDSHDGFRLYASEWKDATPSPLRLEVAMHFDSQTRTIGFEERRRYE